MVTVFLLLQAVCAGLQSWCLVYTISTRKDIFDVGYGFALWGIIPVWLLGMLIQSAA